MQQQLLQQLRDIHTPDPVGWWPLAPGWWILIALVLIATVSLLLVAIHRHRRNAYKRQALESARQYFAQYQRSEDTVNYLEQMSQLLRRVLLCIGEREETAKATGEQWVALLNRYGNSPLTQETSNALALELYRPNPRADVTALNKELTNWIRSHRSTTNA